MLNLVKEIEESRTKLTNVLLELDKWEPSDRRIILTKEAKIKQLDGGIAARMDKLRTLDNVLAQKRSILLESKRTEIEAILFPDRPLQLLELQNITALSYKPWCESWRFGQIFTGPEKNGSKLYEADVRYYFESNILPELNWETVISSDQAVNWHTVLSQTNSDVLRYAAEDIESGFPDSLVKAQQTLIGIEYKSACGRLSFSQTVTFSNLEKAGLLILVVWPISGDHSRKHKMRVAYWRTFTTLAPYSRAKTKSL